jgi:hypothetical protein
MDCITVVCLDESYSDGNVQVWNCNDALAFPGFNSVDFYGIADHTQNSKADKKRNNHAICMASVHLPFMLLMTLMGSTVQM